MGSMGLNRNAVAVLLEVAGGASLTVGAGMLNRPAAFIVGGLLTLMFGLAIETEQRAR
jgi:hypothetical protein